MTRCSPSSFRDVTRRGAVSLLAGLGATVVASGRSSRAQSRALKLGHILVSESQLGAGARVFAEEVPAATDGRFSVEQYPNGVLGGEVEMLQAVQRGTLDLAFITGAPLPNIIPEVGVFNIPFLFRDIRHARAVLDSTIGQSYLDKFRPKNLVALAWGENGIRHITNSKRPILTPADLKGLKLRLPQSDVMLAGFKALGADVAPLPFPELYDALKKGRFDGQENPIATILASKFDQVQKHLTLSSHVYDPAMFVMSVAVFESLSPQDRDAMLTSATIAAGASRSFASRAQTRGVDILKQAGMQVVPGIDAAQFSTSMAPVLPDYDRSFGTQLIQKIRDFA